MKAYITSISVISPQHKWVADNWLDEIVSYNSNILKCIEPDYKDLITPAQLRRMPRILKIGLYTALECINNSVNPDAIITATASGCLHELENFLAQVVDNKNQVLSPASFVLSTSNLIASQLAIAKANNNYNMNYINRSLAFPLALNDALMLLEENAAKNVLIGTVDEITPYHHKLFQYLKYWRPVSFNNLDLFNQNSSGTIAGEGSAFFNLSSSFIPNCPVLKGVFTLYKPLSMLHLHNNLHSFLNSINLKLAQIDLLILGNNGDNQFDNIYQDFLNINFHKNQPVAYYKSLCGEYFGSSGFALALASYILKKQLIPNAVHLINKPNKKIQNILIYNQFRNKEHSFILLANN